MWPVSTNLLGMSILTANYYLISGLLRPTAPLMLGKVSTAGVSHHAAGWLSESPCGVGPEKVHCGQQERGLRCEHTSGLSSLILFEACTKGWNTCLYTRDADMNVGQLFTPFK